MSDNTGGGKSTQVQAPQRTAAPVNKSTSGSGFLRKQKRSNGMTAQEAGEQIFKKEAPAVAEHAETWKAPINPYPLLHRNDSCGCKSGKKYKKCCYGK